MRLRPSPCFRKGILVAAVLWAGLPALAATDGPYSVEVLVDGVSLHEIRARGATYVEAVRGAEYAIRLRNHTGRRVAVSLAVDGLNTIDARHTSAHDARKWVLDPYETVTLRGWQTGSETARRFVFTSENDSYGAWIGHTEDLGSITAAFFRELPLRPPSAPITEPSPRRFRKDQGESRSAPAPGAAAESDSYGQKAETLSDEHAATGIGREVDHRVRTVQFRPERRPAAVVHLRYEYHDALVRLGVLPERYDPLSRRERSRGFTNDGFAPDPYRGR